MSQMWGLGKTFKKVVQFFKQIVGGKVGKYWKKGWGEI